MAIKKNRHQRYAKEVDYQVGARKSYPVSATKVWDYLISLKGLKVWLGSVDPNKLLSKEYFQTGGGDEGKLRVFKPYSHLRMNWKHSCWENLSTLQIRVTPNKSKTTVSFHQEKLKDNRQRKDMKAYWQHVLKQLEKELENV